LKHTKIISRIEWQETCVKLSPLCRLSGAPRLPPPTGKSFIALKKKRQLEEAKRVMELDSNMIAIAVIITALPIIAALGWMLTVLAVGYGAH
jgi:hypothetical protein